ncbi:MAG: hypothetical protein HPY71_03260 [Firmicutes bacterium]|nr:hypothetical protein [Bacillota bacterium]
MSCGGLRKWFLGYNVTQVDKHIAELLARYRQELDELGARKGASLSENQRLSREVSMALDKVSAYETKREAALAAHANALRSAQYLEEMARYKAEQIIAAAEREVQTHKAYLATLSIQIDKSRQEFEKLVDSIRSFLDQAASKANDATSLPSAPVKVAGRILAGGNAEDTFVTRGRDGFLRVNVAPQNLKMVAQDGTPVGQVSNLVLDGVSGTTIGYEITGSAIPGSVPDGSVIPASCVLAMRSDRLIVTSSLLEGLPSLDLEVYGAQAPPDQAPPDKKENREPSSRVRQDIEKKEMRYVVGKIAGRDLVGDDGVSIVAKGDEITQEVVEKARAQGKLAELIVHMVMPGMSPDEIEADPTVKQNIS